MNLYPAMSAHMGRWDYYIVKMNMRELAESVKFAHDVYDDKTLNDAIQRILSTSRVKKEIVTYLSRQRDRFFASVVVAALGGNPKWYPVFVTDDDRFALFRDDERLNETFGVLAFDGTQEYYALDGQHRLAGIKALIDPEEPSEDVAPEGFRDEELSVLVVVPTKVEEEREFLERYRRLFGNLNRYAKAMDKATNIIMDEDDALAIVTRRLISEHAFFRYIGRERESSRIKTDKGKNLRTSDSYFTSIEALYDVNKRLLESAQRRTLGWGFEDERGEDTSTFLRFRPSDEFLDALYMELGLYWDGILEELPVLWKSPPDMRQHGADPEAEEDPQNEQTDHLLFWPIGQEMLAAMVRNLLDKRLEDPRRPTREGVASALRGLGALEWHLHRPPWRYFLLTQDDGDWKMRSEDRKATVEIGQQLQEWLVGLDELDDEALRELRRAWSQRLIPAQPPERVDEIWQSIRGLRVATF